MTFICKSLTLSSTPQPFILLLWFSYLSSQKSLWNSLLPHILQSQTLSSFRRHVKIHYFQSAYPDPQRPSLMRPDSLLRLWRYITHSLTHLLTYLCIAPHMGIVTAHGHWVGVMIEKSQSTKNKPGANCMRHSVSAWIDAICSPPLPITARNTTRQHNVLPQVKSS